MAERVNPLSPVMQDGVQSSKFSLKSLGSPDMDRPGKAHAKWRKEK
jgi:hypothetical protein